MKCQESRFHCWEPGAVRRLSTGVPGEHEHGLGQGRAQRDPVLQGGDEDHPNSQFKCSRREWSELPGTQSVHWKTQQGSGFLQPLSRWILQGPGPWKEELLGGPCSSAWPEEHSTQRDFGGPDSAPAKVTEQKPAQSQPA